MTKTKKFLSIVLAILMIATSIPFAFAADTVSGTFGVDNALTWTLDNGLLTISGNGAMCESNAAFEKPWAEYIDSITDVVIEEGVTNIADSAFYGHSNLKTAYIANSVKTIYGNAFRECGSMEKIFIGSGVEMMTYYCFYNTNCTVHYNGTSAMWYAIDEDYNGKPWSTVHYLTVSSKEATCVDNGFEDAYACSSCDTTFGGTIIPATGEHTRVNDVCTVCGDGCTHPTWTNSVCDICGDPCVHPSYTDSKCDACKTNCYHNNFENGICTDCSYECEHYWYDYDCYTCGLKGGELNSDIIWTLNTDTGVFILNGTGDMPEYSYYRDVPWFNDLRGYIKTVIISEGITSICADAFYWCANLTSVTLPDTLNKIGGAAFCDCSSLENIVIPSGVTTLDASTFAWCIALKTIHYLGTENELTIDETNNELADGILHYCEEKAATVTCTTAGLTQGWYCATCEKDIVEQKTIDALGHDIVIDNAVAPTCTKTGLTAGQHCSRCDDVTVAQEVIPSNGHTEETVKGYAATCTETGLSDGVKCSACGDTLTAQEVIPSNGHTKETVKGYAATCTETGLSDGVKCSVCGDTLTAQEVIPSNGHTEETVKGYDATCTETGLTDGVKCSACGDTLTEQEVIPSNGHTKETVKGYAATCTETGLSDGVKCSACGDTLTEQVEIPASGHTEETVKGYDATCTEAGLTDGVKCSACGDTLTEQTVISAKGHADANGDGVCDNGGEAIEKQEPDTPDEPSDGPTDDTTNDCDHICHSNNAIVKVLWKIISFIYRLFNIQQYCDCGITHW